MSGEPQQLSLLVDLASLVDGDREIGSRHRPLLASSPAAQKLAEDAAVLAERVGEIGRGFAPSAGFQARLARQLAEAEQSGAVESVGDPFADVSVQQGIGEQGPAGSSPGFGRRPSLNLRTTQVASTRGFDAVGEAREPSGAPDSERTEVDAGSERLPPPTSEVREVRSGVGRSGELLELSIEDLSADTYGQGATAQTEALDFESDTPDVGTPLPEDFVVPARRPDPDHSLELYRDDPSESPAGAIAHGFAARGFEVAREPIEAEFAPSDIVVKPSSMSALALQPHPRADKSAMPPTGSVPEDSGRTRWGVRVLAVLVGCALTTAVATLYSLPEQSQWSPRAALQAIGASWLARLWGSGPPDRAGAARAFPKNPLLRMEVRTWPGAAVAAGDTEASLPLPAGLQIDADGVRTSPSLVAEFKDAHQLLTLGRDSDLHFQAQAGGQLALRGALLVARSRGAEPLVLATEHAALRMSLGAAIVRSDQEGTLIAVLQGEVSVDGRPGDAITARPGSLVRISASGAPHYEPLATIDGLMTDFVPWSAAGHMGRLVPLSRGGGRKVPQRPLGPRRHAVRARLSTHRALVEVTEVFEVRSAAAPLRYQLPLPPGAVLAPTSTASAKAGDERSKPLPPATITTVSRSLGSAGAVVVEPTLEISPIAEWRGRTLEVKTRYLVPLLRIGSRREFNYVLSGPIEGDSGASAVLERSPVEFSAEIRLQDEGELQTTAAFAQRGAGGKVVTAHATVGADGLSWRVGIDRRLGDGTVSYSATAARSMGRGAGAAPPTGVLLYHAPRFQPEQQRDQHHHWVAVVDDGEGMSDADRALVTPFVAQLLSSLPSRDRVTLLRCGLSCRPTSPPPSGPELGVVTRWAVSAERTRGEGFDLGRSLLFSQALRNDNAEAEAMHIVVLSSRGASAGTADAAELLQFKRRLIVEQDDELDEEDIAPLPTVSVVQLGQLNEAEESLQQLARQLGGRYLRADSTLLARTSALSLLRYGRQPPLVDAYLNLTQQQHVQRTVLVPNVGGESDYQAFLPSVSPPFDGAILAGRLAGSLFERRYTLAAPAPQLEISPDSIVASLKEPEPPAKATPVLAAEAAIAAYEEALKSGRKKSQSPAKPPQLQLFDLTADSALALPWEQEAAAAERSAQEEARLLRCPPAAPEFCGQVAQRWLRAPLESSQGETSRDGAMVSVLLRLGMRSEALDAAVRLAAVHPTDPELQLQAGRAYLVKDQAQWACRHMQRAAELTQERGHLLDALKCWSTQPATEAQLFEGLLQERLAKMPRAVRRASGVGGLTAAATWTSEADVYDLGVVDQAGRVFGLLDGTTAIERGTALGEERLAVSDLPPGVYTLELWRNDVAKPGEPPEPVRIEVEAGKQTLSLQVEPAQARTELARLVVRAP